MGAGGGGASTVSPVRDPVPSAGPHAENHPDPEERTCRYVISSWAWEPRGEAPKEHLGVSQQAEAGEGKEHRLSPSDLRRIPKQGPRTRPTQPAVGHADSESDGFPFLEPRGTGGTSGEELSSTHRPELLCFPQVSFVM